MDAATSTAAAPTTAATAATAAPLAPASATRRRRIAGRSARWWLAVSSAAIAIIAPLPYLTSSLTSLARDDNDIAANYASRPGWVQVAFYLHVCAGGVAMLLVPLQLSSRIRRRRPQVHRVVGRVVALSIAIAAPAGLAMAPYNEAGPIGVAGFGLLAVGWFGCMAMSIATIRRGDRVAHRRWAIRTFALTYAAVMLRLWLGVMMAAQIAGGIDADLAFDRAYVLVPFLCWVPNIIVAELVLRDRRSVTTVGLVNVA